MDVGDRLVRRSPLNDHEGYTRDSKGRGFNNQRRSTNGGRVGDEASPSAVGGEVALGYGRVKDFEKRVAMKNSSWKGGQELILGLKTIDALSLDRSGISS
ncbi:hypothetical protein PIB30_085895 [Stylosanthes scabra]|uniref:Uncharacterized protein n=1 Tax=Stylosanthes scabra TaxID=79078 RepID=A0ABU6TSH0_9FABA|nr:hypothetical protein [Stylosanthes scabra]